MLSTKSLFKWLPKSPFETYLNLALLNISFCLQVNHQYRLQEAVCGPGFQVRCLGGTGMHGEATIRLQGKDG